jgi:hypothetical protein
VELQGGILRSSFSLGGCRSFFPLDQAVRRLVTCSFLGAIVAALVIGCDKLWPNAYWRSERYVLVAIDTKGQMDLEFDLGNGTTAGLVDATVFSIGVDDKHIVVKEHPKTDGFGHFDRSKTNYFVVERTASGNWADRKKGVRGPLSEKEFEKLASTLSLPTFTKTFNDLQ